MAGTQTKTPASAAQRSSAQALDALAEAVESGAGLPETARRAGAALGASVALIDSRGAVLAVAAGSPVRGARAAVEARGRDGDRPARVGVGRRPAALPGPRATLPEPALLRMVTTLLALEVERTRAPERAGEAAVGSFVKAVLDGEIDDRRDLIARGKELGVDLENGGSVLAVRIMPARPRRGRLAGARADDRRRAARGASCRARSTALRGGAHRGDRARRRGRARRAAPHRRCCARSTTRCRASRSCVGRSRVAVDPMDLHRAAAEALLAANVAVARHAGSRCRACCRSRTPAPTGCCCPR